MKKELGFTYWQDGDDWLGFLDEYPDYLRVPDSQCSASALVQGRSGAVRFADGRF
jgi:hypothetical protein